MVSDANEVQDESKLVPHLALRDDVENGHRTAFRNTLDSCTSCLNCPICNRQNRTAALGLEPRPDSAAAAGAAAGCERHGDGYLQRTHWLPETTGSAHSHRDQFTSQ